MAFYSYICAKNKKRLHKCYWFRAIRTGFTRRISMQKSDKRNIAYIIIGALMFALIINVFLSVNWEIIPSRFTKEEWFSFWASYATSVVAIIVGYYTIVSANRNSQKAIMQQNVILVRQKSDVIYKEIADEIKRHISLFNIVNFTSTILYMNEDDLSRSKEKVVEKKASIEERRLQWGLLRNMYLCSNSIWPITEEYDKIFREAVDKLVNYAKLELSIYNVIDDIKQSENIASLLNQLIDRTKERYAADSDNAPDVLLSKYEQQREENLQRQYELNNRYKDVVAQIREEVNSLTVSQEAVMDSSAKFLSQLSNYVFVQASEMKLGRSD